MCTWTPEGILFPRLLESLSFALVFNNTKERSVAKNYRPVSFLSVVSEIFEKLVNNRVDSSAQEML